MWKRRYITLRVNDDLFELDRAFASESSLRSSLTSADLLLVPNADTREELEMELLRGLVTGDNLSARHVFGTGGQPVSEPSDSDAAKRSAFTGTEKSREEEWHERPLSASTAGDVELGGSGSVAFILEEDLRSPPLALLVTSLYLSGVVVPAMERALRLHGERAAALLVAASPGAPECADEGSLRTSLFGDLEQQRQVFTHSS